MLSVSAMSGGQGAYYTALAREDYYLEGGEPPGVWCGEGAKALGFSGEIDKEVFSKIFDGLDAKGRPLVQNAGQENRQAGWDLTFSAPKSVSVLWSLLPSEAGAKIRECQLEAVRKACQYLEDEAGWTRRGKAGAIREKASLVVGLFEHGTSRAGDPQLHTHALFMNLAVRHDGTTGTIESKPFYQHKMAAGALYRSELAAQLQQKLGVEIERVRSWFEVKGIDKNLTEHWSTRRKEIEEALAQSGFQSSKASEMAALNTRHVKQHIAREELFEEWKVKGKEMNWGAEQAQSIVKDRPFLHRDPPQVAKALALKEALEDITNHQAFFSEREFVRKVAEEAQGKGIGADDVRKATRDYLEHNAVHLRRGDQLFFTTPEILEMEKDMLSRADNSRNGTLHQVGDLVVDQAIKENSHLRHEQKRAIEHITRGKGSIVAVSGMAGTGKTTMLKVAAQIWRESGFIPRGIALSGKAADGLNTEAGIESSTIAKALFDLEKERNLLTEKTVLILDEAGMVGTKHMSRLIKEAEKAKAKLVLVGDAKQLQPVDAGGPFAAIVDLLGDVRMTEIIRQKEPWAREAVLDMANGVASRALEAFASRGQVSITDDKSQARSVLLKAWEVAGLEKPQENLILTGTNQDAVILNRDAQAVRKKQGYLGDESVKAAGEVFHQGDRILFTKNAAPRGIRNGSIGTIDKVESQLSQLHVILDNGRRVQVPLEDYDSVKLGYAVTTHKSQGMTTQNTFILTDEAMQDRELSYVQASRARGTTRIFTTTQEAGIDMNQLVKSMSTSHQKELASSLQTVAAIQKPDLERANSARTTDISIQL
ncbi:MobF family relaxase [Prosthecobacter dejongeii]|uniref:Ti-type conjugative transfer relaxase TraA n=1 Tax=Prosthecobacter dejongeii TaxID=48465 RepID=A0A7W8DS34_9BACT|nr:MobF family relaxase [Prosthecobacter dejongeii]MBB5040549.1 Ti-type conjugative transfer relaxase TraA [Prosthecobacter dejongeii]